MSRPDDELLARPKAVDDGAPARDDFSLLLVPEPEAQLIVELVDTPVPLAYEQFEALLIDSECEV